jgi:hypothetical protein
MLRRITWGACFVVALVVNPSVGCGGGGAASDFTYTESDMERAVVGTYVGTVGVDGASEQVTLTLARATGTTGAAPQGLRPQCGERLFFVKPAAACLSRSVMPVSGELTSTGSTIPSGHVTGELESYRTLGGPLSLQLAGGGTIGAAYEDGAFTGWVYTDAKGTEVPLSLTRSQ